MTANALAWQEAAATNLLEARRRNGRLGSKKSRGGCLTCKARRVKCDETPGACERCTQSGRTCEGYAEPTRMARHGRLPVGMPISQFLAIRGSDKRAFDYFISWSAPRLAGSLDKTFWCGHVLQLALAEPMVLESIVAISTLYEHPQFCATFTRDDPFRRPNSDDAKIPALQTGHPWQPPPVDVHHAEALRAYNRAMEAFRSKVEAGKATPTLALLSCILFICIEVIRDDIFAALALFTKGSELLKQFAHASFEGQELQLIETIKLMFARIGVLAAAFGHPHPMDMPPQFVIVGQHRVFANLDDARTSLYALMADSHTFIRDAAVYKASFYSDAGERAWKVDSDYSISISDVKQAYDEEYGMSETSAAVLPATINLRTGDGALSEPTDYKDESASTTELPRTSSKDQERVFKGHDGMFGLLDVDQQAIEGYDYYGAVYSQAHGFRKAATLDGKPISKPFHQNHRGSDGNKIDMYVVGGRPELNPRLLTPDRNSGSSDKPATFAKPEHASISNACALNDDEAHTAKATLGRQKPSVTYTGAIGVEPAPADTPSLQSMSNRSLPSVEDLLNKQELFEERLGQWYDAFQWAKSPLQGSEPETASSLSLYYHVSFIWLTTRLAAEQMVFDQYRYHFEQILHHGAIYVNAKAHEKPVFTFEVAAVPPLYFTATKCRVPSIRRKALQILSRAPRKECMWGATSTAQLAARIIAIEEEGLDLPTPTWDGISEDARPVTDSVMPPESSRVQNMEILKNKATADFEVRVTRYRQGNGRLVRVIQDYPI